MVVLDVPGVEKPWADTRNAAAATACMVRRVIDLNHFLLRCCCCGDCCVISITLLYCENSEV